MGRLRVKATECKYREWVRRMKEQFRNGMNDQTTTAEIIKKLTTIRDTSKTISEKV